jgi:hypothetical protein
LCSGVAHRGQHEAFHTSQSMLLHCVPAVCKPS